MTRRVLRRCAFLLGVVRSCMTWHQLATRLLPPAARMALRALSGTAVPLQPRCRVALRRCRAPPPPPAARHYARRHPSRPVPPPEPPVTPRLERYAAAAERASDALVSVGLPPVFPPPAPSLLLQRGAAYIAYLAVLALLVLGVRRAIASAFNAASRLLFPPRVRRVPPRRAAEAELDGVAPQPVRADAPVVELDGDAAAAMERAAQRSAAQGYAAKLWTATTAVLLYCQELLSNAAALRP